MQRSQEHLTKVQRSEAHLTELQRSEALLTEEQQIGPAARIAGLIDQHIECKGGQVIGDRIDILIFFLNHYFQITLATVASLGTDGAV